MKPVTFAALALASASLVTLGCDKGASPSSAGASSSAGDTGAAAPSPTGAAAAAPAGGKGGLVAACVKKNGACTEYRGSIPDLSEELCKGTDGAFNKGADAAPCPTEKLLGTCVNKATPEATNYFYGGPDDLDIYKGICEGLDGKWSAPAAPTSSATAPGKAPAKAAPARAAAPAHKKR
jgi:hypothetical protein